MRELNAILTIAYRDLVKFLRDPVRMVSSLLFPIFFIGALGGSLQTGMGSALGYNYLAFLYTGVLAMTLFQSATMGIVSLIEDRENDFSQEIFIAPISRYAIIFGKILGESLVALPQGLAIVGFGYLIGVRLTFVQTIALLPAALAVCLTGGAFGMLILANLGSQRAAGQVFTFIMFPQYFLAGVFNPIKVLPPYLEILSRITPLRYAVDLTRVAFYASQPDYSKVVADGPVINLIVLALMFLSFLAVGTALFVRAERNR